MSNLFRTIKPNTLSKENRGNTPNDISSCVSHRKGPRQELWGLSNVYTIYVVTFRPSKAAFSIARWRWCLSIQKKYLRNAKIEQLDPTRAYQTLPWRNKRGVFPIWLLYAYVWQTLLNRCPSKLHRFKAILMS